MNDNNDDQVASDLHDRQVAAITQAVAKMLPAFGPKGFSPEAIFEGGVKGACVAMMVGRDIGADAIAELLDDLAAAFRENPPLDRSKFHVVN